MASGLTSNYNDSGYTFTAPNDGMMLGSLIQDPTRLGLSTSSTSTPANLTGTNGIYPRPGQSENDFFFLGTYDYMNYGTPPNDSFMARAGSSGRSTVTASRSTIYNFANPGVYLLDLAGSGTNIVPIINSTAFLGFLYSVDVQNGFIVYPGWGFRLFNGGSTWQSNFQTTTTPNPPGVTWTRLSYTYFNDTDAPLFFTLAASESSNQKVYGLNTDSSTNPVNTMPPGTRAIPIMVQATTVSTTTNTAVNRSMADDEANGIQIFFRSATPLYSFGQTN
jgi:hypothetical protein